MITYELESNLYINMTNRCSNNCEFCIRNSKEHYLSHYNLWLDKEPIYEDFLDEIRDKDINKYNEIVFCGYGEPTYRLDLMQQIAEYFKGKKRRLNTNGQGNLINGRDIVPELSEFIDTVSISLNASDNKEYQKKCKSIYENAFDEVIDFAKKCVENNIETRFTVVEGCVENMDLAREVAEKNGIEFFVRELI